jgi:hypothetical protein
MLRMMLCRRFGCRMDRRSGPKPRCAGAVRLALALALAAGALGACSNIGDGDGALVVDPAVYAAYHCKDLIAASKQLAARRKELRELIDKAGGGVGTVVSTVAYRSDYDAVLEKQKILRRTTAERKCQLTPAAAAPAAAASAAPAYRSDQIIH